MRCTYRGCDRPTKRGYFTLNFVFVPRCKKHDNKRPPTSVIEYRPDWVKED